MENIKGVHTALGRALGEVPIVGAEAAVIDDHPGQTMTLEALEKMMGSMQSWFPKSRSKHSQARALRAKAKAKRRKKKK